MLVRSILQSQHFLRLRRHPGRTALAIWLIVFGVVAVLAVLQPRRHTVTPVYLTAAHAWVTGGKLYHVTDGHGYQYLPIAAVLYVPFERMPRAIGEVLWRFLTIALFASALWRLARVAGGFPAGRHFLLLTLLCLPSSLSSARSGQFNLPLAALLLHAAIDLGSLRWNRAAVGLAFAVALKPFSMPMLLLSAALHRPIRVRGLVGMVIVIASPFLFARTSYVLTQYQYYWKKMHALSDPNERFCNLHGLWRSMGLDAPASAYLIAAVIAGLLTLALAYYAQRSAATRMEAAIFMFALCASYLMLFNPKTETNSYVILAPAIAAFAVRRQAAFGWDREAWFLAILALGLGVENYGSAIFRGTNFWLKPLIAVVFVAYLVSVSVRASKRPSPAFALAD